MDKTSTAYKKAKTLADKTYEKHSAYKSMFIAKKYAEFGGTSIRMIPKKINQNQPHDGSVRNGCR